MAVGGGAPLAVAAPLPLRHRLYVEDRATGPQRGPLSQPQRRPDPGPEGDVGVAGAEQGHLVHREVADPQRADLHVGRPQPRQPVRRLGHRVHPGRAVQRQVQREALDACPAVPGERLQQWRQGVQLGRGDAVPVQAGPALHDDSATHRAQTPQRLQVGDGAQHPPVADGPFGRLTGQRVPRRQHEQVPRERAAHGRQLVGRADRHRR